MSLHDIWRGDVMPLSGIAVAIGRNSFDPPAPVVPVFDIHNRTSIWYDSGRANNNSGVLGFDAARQVLYFNPSNSGYQTVMTFVCIEVYDNAGGNAIQSTNTSVVFDTTRFNTHPSVFVFNGTSNIQINMSGIYEFSYHLTAENRNATFTNLLVWIERQAPGGGFAEIPGSRSYGLIRNNVATAIHGSSSATVIFPAVAVGETFRLRAVADSAFAVGTEPLQTALSSNFLIKKVG